MSMMMTPAGIISDPRYPFCYLSNADRIQPPNAFVLEPWGCFTSNESETTLSQRRLKMVSSNADVVRILLFLLLGIAWQRKTPSFWLFGPFAKDRPDQKRSFQELVARWPEVVGMDAALLMTKMRGGLSAPRAKSTKSP